MFAKSCQGALPPSLKGSNDRALLVLAPSEEERDDATAFAVALVTLSLSQPNTQALPSASGSLGDCMIVDAAQLFYSRKADQESSFSCFLETCWRRILC